MPLKMAFASDSIEQSSPFPLPLLIPSPTGRFPCAVSEGTNPEIEVVNPTFYLTHSQYIDTGLTSLSADPITPEAWQGSHWSAHL